MSIKWTARGKTLSRIKSASVRARKLAKEAAGVDIPLINWLMDLEAVHCNGCPLDFERLLSFPDADFGHDVFGIRRHLNRSTGKLEDYFLPRCAKKCGGGE